LLGDSQFGQTKEVFDRFGRYCAKLLYLSDASLAFRQEFRLRLQLSLCEQKVPILLQKLDTERCQYHVKRAITLLHDITDIF
jgi:hypothetical protein